MTRRTAVDRDVMARSRRAGWRAAALAVGLVAAGAAFPIGQALAAPTPPSGPFVTLLLGRSMWVQSESGQAVPGQPTLADIAPLLAQRGVAATGVIVPGRTAESGIQNINGNLYPSWAELAQLRDQYGWSFVSNGQNRVNVINLSPAERYAEVCGSLDAFYAHGHMRAWGMYGPNSNNITADIATNLVATCFSFVRYYWGNNLNSRSAVTAPPYYVHTDDTHGGSCNLSPCTGSASVGSYMLPSEMVSDLQAAGPDQWVVLSTYKLLTGSKFSGNRRWDCTSPDPRKHWTSELESYCLNDLLAALDAIKPGSVVTDPATVGEAWGRLPSTPPPTSSTTTTSSTSSTSTSSTTTSSTTTTSTTTTTTTTTTAPGGTDGAPPNTTISTPRAGTRVGPQVSVAGNATDDRAVARVRVAVRNQVTRQWLRDNGSWGAYDTRDAVVVTPGAKSSGWTLSVTLPNGSYGLSALAVDAAGKVDPTDAWVTFTVG
jgi:hypothetical protein